MNLLDTKISVFKNCSDPKPTSIITLRYWFNHVDYNNKIRKLQSLKKGTKQYSDFKAYDIPAITPSGIFSYRNEVSLIEHSGLLQFDIDHKDNPFLKTKADAIVLRNRLSKLKIVAYASISASGLGVWGLVRILKIELHKQHLKSLCKYFARNGVVLDDSPSNVASLRLWSFDPDAYINENSKVYDKYLIEQPPIVGVNPISTTGFNKLLNHIVTNRIDITGSESDWFNIGSAIYSEFGITGENYFHQISQFHKNYSQKECTRKYKHIAKLNHKTSIGVIYNSAKNNGIIVKNLNCNNSF